ncbi:hypothetical protein CLAIMM_14780 [Cladophialophora immunda]|nr:hypothetical protein CLAIMM_14780 [Cladophialophora immunda]
MPSEPSWKHYGLATPLPLRQQQFLLSSSMLFLPPVLGVVIEAAKGPKLPGSHEDEAVYAVIKNDFMTHPARCTPSSTTTL